MSACKRVCVRACEHVNPFLHPTHRNSTPGRASNFNEPQAQAQALQAHTHTRRTTRCPWRAWRRRTACWWAGRRSRLRAARSHQAGGCCGSELLRIHSQVSLDRLCNDLTMHLRTSSPVVCRTPHSRRSRPASLTRTPSRRTPTRDLSFNFNVYTTDNNSSSSNNHNNSSSPSSRTPSRLSADAPSSRTPNRLSAESARSRTPTRPSADHFNAKSTDSSSPMSSLRPSSGSRTTRALFPRSDQYSQAFSASQQLREQQRALLRQQQQQLALLQQQNALQQQQLSGQLRSSSLEYVDTLQSQVCSFPTSNRTRWFFMSTL